MAGQLWMLWAGAAAVFAREGDAIMAGMRHFGTGATRDQDTSKHDYEGFNSPLVEKAFGEYMTRHRIQPDGSVRASDNWQLGIPLDAYIKSLVRHVEDLRLHHRGYADEAVDSDLISVLCAIRFNVNGYLFETLKQRRLQKEKPPVDAGASVKGA